MTKITEEDVYMILDIAAHENGEYKWNVKFLSLEGNDICFKKEAAEKIKKQMIGIEY